MATSFEKQISLNFKALPRHAKKALDFLANQKWIKKSSWYLAGGTALALQLGHRNSYDLDFFTQNSVFNNTSLLKHFLTNSNWKTNINTDGTIYGELFKAKISFISYPFFKPNQSFAQYGAISILKPADIAVMKIVAISQRGKKRDFIDLYWYAKNIEPLDKIIPRLKYQYPSVAHDYHHILKSLVYFTDAENDPMPNIFFKATWQEIKKFFQKEIPKVATKVIKLF